MDPSSLCGISDSGCITYWGITVENEDWAIMDWAVKVTDLGSGPWPWLTERWCQHTRKAESGGKGQQTLETDGLIHHPPEIKKKKKGCSEHCTHSNDCEFHNCGDLPSHYTHTSTAASVHSSRKVKSGEDTKYKGCSALRKLVHKMIIQALVERKACRSEGLTGYYSLYINSAFLHCII